jgi:putative SOS response-associated peptidase YedK
MFRTMKIEATPFDADAPQGDRRLIIRYNPDDGKREMIHAIWGSNPRFTDGVNYRFVRSEGKPFHSNRCLIPASEFLLTVGKDKKQYRARLDSGDFFYLAGIWEAAIDDWPVCFRIVTVYASSDIVDYQERHGAIIPRSRVSHWLDATLPVEELLVTPPRRTLLVEAVASPRSRGSKEAKVKPQGELSL